MGDRPFLKLVVVCGVVFAGYNVLLSMRRQSNYETVYFQEPRSSVESKMGGGISKYTCGSPEASIIAQVEAFCQQENVVDVSQYRLCYVTQACPTMILVAYDGNGNMIYKFRQH